MANRNDVEKLVAQQLVELLKKAKLKPSMEEMHDIVKAVADVVIQNKHDVNSPDFKNILRPTLATAIGLRMDPHFDSKSGLDLTNPMEKLKKDLSLILKSPTPKIAEAKAKMLLEEKLAEKLENNLELQKGAAKLLDEHSPVLDIKSLTMDKLLFISPYVFADGSPKMNDSLSVADANTYTNDPFTDLLKDVYGESEEQDNKANVQGPVDTPDEVRKFVTPFDAMHKGPTPKGGDNNAGG